MYKRQFHCRAPAKARLYPRCLGEPYERPRAARDLLFSIALVRRVERAAESRSLLKYHGRKAALFQGKRRFDPRGAAADDRNGAPLSLIHIFIGSCVVRLRALGSLPAAVPVNALMMRLPKNKFLLALLFAAVFGPLTPLVNLALIRFYGITNFGFAQLALWKVVYSCLLSAKIIELTILRYVQPDCGTAREREQHGAGAVSYTHLDVYKRQGRR